MSTSLPSARRPRDEETRTLLGYPEEIAGRLMTPDYIAVHPDWTVEAALQHIRVHGRDRETVYRIRALT